MPEAEEPDQEMDAIAEAPPLATHRPLVFDVKQRVENIDASSEVCGRQGCVLGVQNDGNVIVQYDGKACCNLEHGRSLSIIKNVVDRDLEQIGYAARVEHCRGECQVEGLSEVLERAKLDDETIGKINAWCCDQQTAELEGLQECFEQVAADCSLLPLPRKRLRKALDEPLVRQG